MSTLVITIISLCAIGVVSAVILYFVAQKFKVEEDPRIDIVEGLLPGVNEKGEDVVVPGLPGISRSCRKIGNDGRYPVSGRRSRNHE